MKRKLEMHLLNNEKLHDIVGGGTCTKDKPVFVLCSTIELSCSPGKFSFTCDSAFSHHCDSIFGISGKK